VGRRLREKKPQISPLRSHGFPVETRGADRIVCGSL
jgi:hypothetical protein